jgi:hypothetical protein
VCMLVYFTFMGIKIIFAYVQMCVFEGKNTCLGVRNEV